MIYPKISLTEWMKLNPGLEPQKGECSCGKTGITTLPIISTELVGLAMPPCECGDNCPTLIVKARSKETQSEMNKFFI